MSHASCQVVGGGVSLLLLIVVGGSSVPLSPLSGCSHAELWGMCCLGDTPETAACRQPGSDCPHPFAVAACLSLLCIALIKTLTKCNLERSKGLVSHFCI